MSSKTRPVPCLGIWGKMFGHKFELYGYSRENCMRCGIPVGTVEIIEQDV